MCWSLAAVAPIQAECPPGEPNPITSGTGTVGFPVLFTLPDPHFGSGFFVLGHPNTLRSDALPEDEWLHSLGDLGRDGRIYYRLDAPAEGPGGWGDPRTLGCPSTLDSARPPIVVTSFIDAVEDLDGDGAWDVVEDLNHNGLLDPGEDRDGDGRLNGGSPPGDPGLRPAQCEGNFREDADCDGRLDSINEDLDGDGLLDPGEDIDGDGRLDKGIEDRNHDQILNDRPFPQPDDIIFLCEEGVVPCNPIFQLPAFYPYGSLKPLLAREILLASVSWNGKAYDFDALNTPTRAITAEDGRQFRVVDPVPLSGLLPRASGVRRVIPPGEYRMHIGARGIPLNDEEGGTRGIFDSYTVEFPGIQPPLPRLSFPVNGNGAGGTFLSLSQGHFFSLASDLGWARSGLRFVGSESLSIPIFFEPSVIDPDDDGLLPPLDICPEDRPPRDHVLHPDTDNNGIGDECDPALAPGARVDSTWVEVPSEASPGPRRDAAATYDERRAVVVLFGGSESPDTWEYDGTSWVPSRTVHAPDARSGHQMAYDSRQGRVLLFGGVRASDGTLLDDLWAYDGIDWQRLSNVGAPPPRRDFGLAYDSTRGRLVIFGGEGVHGVLGDTWIFDGSAWRAVPTPQAPAARSFARMGYDAFHRVTVMAGGFTGDDTWEFDGLTWQPADYRGDLPWVAAGVMTFDPGRRQTVLFGAYEARGGGFPGESNFSTPTAATRLYDGLSWSPLATRQTIPTRSGHAAAFDTRRRVLVVYGGDRNGPLRDTWELTGPDDTDADGSPDAGDNCPLELNPAQMDEDGDEVGDVCDNCRSVRNPAQRDLDRDGAGDACDDDIDGDAVPNVDDVCPAAFYPGRSLALSLPRGAGPDDDGDGVANDCDPCRSDPANDADHDGLCADVDKCPRSFNPGQADANGDGSGDACQPVLDLLDIREDGGEALEVTAAATDPDGDPLGGSIDFLREETPEPITLRALNVEAPDCAADSYRPGGQGPGIGYAFFSNGDAFLLDLDSYLGCDDGRPDFLIARGGCDLPDFLFRPDLLLFNAPFSICIAEADPATGGADPTKPRKELTVQEFSADSVGLVVPAQVVLDLTIPFTSGLPRLSDTSKLSAGTTYLLRITVTDGSTPPVTAEELFLYQGEAIMLISSGSPRAVIRSRMFFECDGPFGGDVVLDGSDSEDAGLGDPLVSYEWFLDPGGPDEQHVGSGPLLTLRLPLGPHTVALRVADASGTQDVAETSVIVQDTIAPTLGCPRPGPEECVGPEGVPVSVVAAATDTCSPAVQVENDRAAGGADASGTFPLGMTEVTFDAVDDAGNLSTCTVLVEVKDTQSPTLELTASPAILWPPNHRSAPVRVEWRAADRCDPSPGVGLVSASSSEPDDAAGDGDGRTTGDIAGAEIGLPDGEVLLRAERSASGPGRTYELLYAATDASGNQASALGAVTVPQHLGSGPEPLMLRVESDGAQGMVKLYWNEVPGAHGYDVISGSLDNIVLLDGRVSLGSVDVLVRGTAETACTEENGGEFPKPGAAFFYLVQYRDEQGGRGFGTATAPGPREPVLCQGGCP